MLSFATGTRQRPHGVVSPEPRAELADSTHITPVPKSPLRGSQRRSAPHSSRR